MATSCTTYLVLLLHGRKKRRKLSLHNSTSSQYLNCIVRARACGRGSGYCGPS